MNDDPKQLDQWLAYRRKNVANLDIRRAVQRELEGTTLASNLPTQDTQNFRFPLIRIATSNFLRLGIFIGWFLANN